MTRREFMKYSAYFLLSLPLISILTKFKKTNGSESKNTPREAMYYKGAQNPSGKLLG